MRDRTRPRRLIERAYPDKRFLWLDTEESSGEVFWLDAELRFSYVIPGACAPRLGSSWRVRHSRAMIEALAHRGVTGEVYAAAALPFGCTSAV